MEKKKGYLKTAENDFMYLKDDYERKHFGNPFCFLCQNICERYLKYVVDEYCSDQGITELLKTHSLRKLVRYIQRELPEFQCNWSTVLKADGFYFNTRYPGEDYIEVVSEDCEECWEAVIATRNAVVDYDTMKVNAAVHSIHTSQAFIDAIKSFD